MSEIIFESNKGVVFEKTSYKNGKCKLAVKDKDSGKSIMTYRYKDVPGLDSPYINWENLNCCNGWTYDENYLYTAVQNNRKLYADIALSMYDDDWVAELNRNDLPTEKEAAALIDKLKAEIPDDCILGSAGSDRDGYRSRTRYIYICKDSAIIEYIDLAEVFNTYERLGITVTYSAKESIKKACGIPLKCFAADEYRDYWETNTPIKLIVIGLLLGYPVETTASLIERDTG